MNDFQIPATMLGKALEAFDSGAKAFDDYATQVNDVFGVDKAAFKMAFFKVKVEASRNKSLANLEEMAASRKVSKSMLALARAAAAHISEHSIEEVKDSTGKVSTPGFVPKVTIIIELDPSDPEKAIAKVISGGVRARTKDGGTKSANSRTSAFEAWKRNKDKDTFKVERMREKDIVTGKMKVLGYRVDGRFVPAKKDGGLGAFLKKVYPASYTVADLASYGQ